MIDLSKAKVTINCPECEFQNEIILGQVEREEEIICNGCLKSIKLVDKDKSTKTATADIKKSLDDLKKIFK